MDNINYKELRLEAGLTLAQLSELSGYSLTTINGLETRGEGSKRLKDKIVAILLQRQEEGLDSEIQFWKNRALLAEEKLRMLKTAMSGWIKKI